MDGDDYAADKQLVVGTGEISEQLTGQAGTLAWRNISVSPFGQLTTRIAHNLYKLARGTKQRSLVAS